jgi:Rieske Fe-S protein
MGVSSDDTRTSTRRALLAGGGAAGVSVALAGCADDPHRSLGSPAPEVTSAAVPADGGGGSTPSGDGSGPVTPTGGAGGSIKTTDIPVNGGKIFPDMDPDGVVVTQPAPGQFRAFSATCTHRGCTLTSVSDGTINCPCHGGRFSIRNGSVVQAGDGIPTATRPLPAKNVTVSGDTIIVN